MSELKPPNRNELLVGTTGKGEVVINHPNLDVDKNGCGHIVFSPEQASDLARLLLQKALDAAYERRGEPMRLRILDLNTPWFWLTAFYIPNAYGKPWLEVGLWKPHSWKRFWFHAWQWEKIPEETGAYAPAEEPVQP